MADRICKHCAAPLPAGAHFNRRYCPKGCAASAAWLRHKPENLERHRVWRYAKHEQWAAERLAAKPVRYCAECSIELPRTANARRRFCSRRCINARSLRDKRGMRLAANRRRRAQIRASASPGVTERDWRRLVHRYSSRCAYCRCSAPITMDHVVPISRGGRHSIGNVIPACFPCNAAKRDDFLAYWLRGISSARLATA